MANVLIGIDLGTTNTKTIVIDPDGRTLAHAAQEYAVETPCPGWAEQQPKTWLQAAVDTTRQALAKADISPAQVAAIGLSGQMHGAVFLDRQGQPVRPAIIWPDQRTNAQVESVYRQVGKEQLGRWTANPIATGFMLVSWLWLMEHEPKAAQATRHLLLPKDYLRYCMTGTFGSEPSDACSTLLFDTAHRCWCTPLLDTFGIEPGILPPIHESTEIAGGLTAEFATAVGLREGTPVVYGGSDQAMQALGNGLIDPGLLSCTIGTGGQLFAPTPEPSYDPALRLHCFCHALPARWHLEAGVLSCGLSLKWLRDNVVGGASYNDLANAAATVQPGAEGLMFAPYLAGERTPHMDPYARAAFVGLTLRHGRAHLARAVMEGVVMALRQGLELMLDLGASAERIVASGGATRHLLWLQLQADIFDRPIHRTQTEEAAALGAAMLAGIGAGLYADAQAAYQQVIRWSDEVIEPKPENVAFYEEVYRSFCNLYPTLKSLQKNGPPDRV